MRRVVFALALLGAAILPGCKKKSQDAQPVITNTSDIKPPAGFNWESSHNVDFTASITDTRFGTMLHAISVYDGDPYNGGNIIAKGTASTNSPYVNKLYLSNLLTEVYVVKASPDGSQIISKVSVSGGSANVSFGATDPTVQRPAQRSAAKVTTDCSSGCTTTITSNTSGVEVNSGNVICITGSGITVSFNNMNGGTVRVCGSNVTLNNVNLNGTAIIITSSGSANIGSLNFNSSSSSLTVDGTLNYSSSFPDNGVVTINGTMNCSGDFNLNSSAGTFTNNGTLNISGTFNKGNSATATNNATMNVSGNFQPNSGTFVNNCSLNISGNYTQSAAVKNYNLIKVTGTSTINSGVELGMYNGAMLKTTGFIDNALVKGYGSTSLVKITGTSTVIVNSGAFLNGALQVCTSVTIDPSKYTGGAAAGCSVYIPVTGCNSEGNGSAAPPDTDGDGVADAIDDYPSDATKAHNNYYPSSTGAATAAFEDQWPTKGDFDLNDVVVSYRYNVVTNAANNVVSVAGTYTLSATGGSLGNGFGVQFPVNRSNVSGTTGGTLEEGQTKAVVLIFNNMRDEMANWNTVPGASTSTPRTYSIAFNVSSGPSISTFGLSGYNPFIWNFGLGANRGREIHLSGHAPTDLANTAYFGTADDSTVASASRYYLTKTGLPYAIEIPVMPFSYPKETIDITQTYLHFAQWAQSGGTSYTDWYSNTATGYRNTANIY